MILAFFCACTAHGAWRVNIERGQCAHVKRQGNRAVWRLQAGRVLRASYVCAAGPVLPRSTAYSVIAHSRVSVRTGRAVIFEVGLRASPTRSSHPRDRTLCLSRSPRVRIARLRPQHRVGGRPPRIEILCPCISLRPSCAKLAGGGDGLAPAE